MPPLFLRANNQGASGVGVAAIQLARMLHLGTFRHELMSSKRRRGKQGLYDLWNR